MKMDKVVASWIRAARDQDFIVESTANGHLRFKSPKGKMAHISAKLSSRSALVNARGNLRDAGLIVPEDRERIELCAKKNLAGLATPPEEVLKPSIMRNGAELPHYLVQQNVEAYAKSPGAKVFGAEVLSQAYGDLYDEPTGEYEEMEIERAMNPEQEKQIVEQQKKDNQQKDDRKALIRLGMSASKVRASFDIIDDHQRTVIRDFLEQAALLDLTVEELLDLFRADIDPKPVVTSTP
jgi:hypothetical protein